MELANPYHSWLVAAQDLASYLRAGNSPPPIPSTVRLPVGEALVAELLVEASHYSGQEQAQYLHSNFLMLGSATQALATLGASAGWNHIKRQRALAAAAPQWRPAGRVEVKVTTRRLLTVVDGQYLTFDYDRVRQIVPDLAHAAVDLRFDDRPAIRFQGPPACVLAVYLVHFLYGEVLDSTLRLPPPPPPGGTTAQGVPEGTGAVGVAKGALRG